MGKSMFRALTAREIDCRVAQSNDKGLSLLLYKDARCDQNILDETVGAFNWQRQHSRDNANCTVLIYDENKKQWVGKEDTGTESNTEAEKGLASDSFKRACFNWGIGRELYSAPFIWISAGKYSTYEKNGKKVCKDRFEVKEIGYDANREINRLKIINVNTRQVVFDMDNDEPDDDSIVAKRKAAFTCDRCGAEITPTTGKGGETVTAEQVVIVSERLFGGAHYCAECQKALKARK